MRRAGIFIQGRAAFGNGPAFQSLNPATNEVLAEVTSASGPDVDEAVAAAARAFPAWRAKSATERGRVLKRAAALLRERAESFAQLETQDAGKPIAESRAVDVPSAADALEYFGGIASGLSGRHVDLGGSAFAYTRREPLGVCAAIGAWNYPLQIACWKLAPALAAGNTMVFKPSELTPLSALGLAELLLEAGLPAGVFNVVQGMGEVGRRLAEHPGVAKISLTGSVPTGKLAMAAAAGTLKNVTMELGGKSPLVLFGDCPLDQAVSAALLANFFTQGEVCSNGTRVFVHESIFEEFCAEAARRAQLIRVGDPADPATQLGALISAQHLEKVLGYVALGKQEGARLLCGGERGAGPGNFVTPAIFAGCTDEMRIVKEEIFGPVMTVLSFRDEEEVVRRANAGPFGLSAGVFTRDLARAHRVIAALDAGTCWINNYNVTPVEIPFGGVKQSGLGRENGLEAFEHYTRVKSVYVALADIPAPF